jgi:mono/diheme cytochrome c family protein
MAMNMSGFRGGFRASVGLAALAAGLVFCQGAALAADAARGKIFFTQKYGCYQCHGTEGQGSAITGPKLAPDPIPYDALSAFIRTSSRNMPPFREQILPNQDLEDIYAYLKSIPPAKDWKTIPLLAND